MLTAERGNPNVVGRNGRLFIHIEYSVVANRFCSPLFVALPIA